MNRLTALMVAATFLAPGLALAAKAPAGWTLVAQAPAPVAPEQATPEKKPAHAKKEKEKKEKEKEKKGKEKKPAAGAAAPAP